MYHLLFEISKYKYIRYKFKSSSHRASYLVPVFFGGSRIAAVKARRKRRTFTAAIIAAWDSRQINSARLYTVTLYIRRLQW